MEKKNIFIIAAGLLAVAFLIYFLSPRQNLSPKILEECKTLSYNNGETNIVFFSDRNDAEKYSQFLLSIPPFNSNKEQFNFFYIPTYTPECEIYKNLALLCYSSEIIKKSASCPNDFIIVIQKKDREIRSSSYMNLISINSEHPLTVLPHEFGHAFALLSDEYVPSILLRKSKNCVGNCEKFAEKDGCFQGCSKEEYYRSINSGLMRTLNSQTYGKFDENLISEKISEKAKITGFASQESIDCSGNEYYLIEGNYNQEKITITEKSIEQGCVGNNGAGDFEYSIVMKDNSTLPKGEFNPELIFTDSQEGGEAIKSEKSFMLKIPIIENSKTLEISRQGEKISETNIQDIKARPCRK